MKKTIKNILMILKKFKFIKYFWIFGIFLIMLTYFCSTSLLTDSFTNVESDVSNEKIKDLFKNNFKNKKLIYKFLDEFKKEKEVENLTIKDVGNDSSIQSLGNNKYLVGTGTSGFWFLKFDDNGLVVQANKIKGDDGDDVPDLTGFNNKIGLTSSIQSLGENKYLVGTHDKGFWLLKFNDDTDKFSIAKKIEGKDGVNVSVLTADGYIGSGSSIQDLGNNKYLVGTYTKGFWLLEFDNEANKFSIAKKIEGKVGVNVLDLTDEHSGRGSSIQSLKNNKYLIGMFRKGFWLLEFDNEANKFSIAKKIEGKAGVNVSDLTKDGDLGSGSSIQKLEDTNKYLVATGGKGFWLLEFDNEANKFSIAKKIEGKAGVNVSDLTTYENVSVSSSIQKLEDTNKYLVGTGTKGFWLLEFDKDSNKFSIANKIKDKDGDVSDLTNELVGYSSSIQSLGENKYLVGTNRKGFWLLEFNDVGLVVQANKIQEIKKVTNDEFNGVYDEKLKKFKKEYKELETLSKFESDDDNIFWKEFVMKTFVIDEENKEWKIVDDYSFSNNEIWTEKKFKEWLVIKNIEPKNDSEENEVAKIDSSNKKLWFLIIIPIVPIVIYLFIYFIKKIKKNNKK